MQINVKNVLNMEKMRGKFHHSSYICSIHGAEGEFYLVIVTCVTDYVFQLNPLTIIKRK